MRIQFSPGTRTVTISSSNAVLKLMKARSAAPVISYRTILHLILALALLLPFVFILTAVVTLEGVNQCTSLGCLGRRLGPRFLSRHDDSVRLVKELYKMLERANSEEFPESINLPNSFSEFLVELKSKKYDASTFAVMLKAAVEKLEAELKKSKLEEQLNKHYAAISIPRGIHCLSLLLVDEYSTNANARRQLPPPELLSVLSDNTFRHFVLSTDNILAAAVVVSSVVSSSLRPERIVFHIITDKKTYSGMHAWFALNPLTPAMVEVKGVHQLGWLTRERVPILGAIEGHHAVRDHYHGHNSWKVNASESPRVFSAKLQATSPKYISILNHLRMYLPELYPNLNKVVFLDDDVVIQRDLSPLWDVDLMGKVNGAVETCKGEDSWVMSKRFRNYFNFSHPLISHHLDPNDCAWAYGMNIFDLEAWRRTNISQTYHFWLNENLRSNLSLWKLGTLPPALIAFRGHVHPIDPSWHMLGLGYQEKTDMSRLRQAAVIHYNGPGKPWLDIGFSHLRPFWTKHVNYTNEFIRTCHIFKPPEQK
ncbi:putative galacturonosyltransferase 14 [Wolffia australiana]